MKVSIALKAVGLYEARRSQTQKQSGLQPISSLWNVYFKDQQLQDRPSRTQEIWQASFLAHTRKTWFSAPTPANQCFCRCYLHTGLIYPLHWHLLPAFKFIQSTCIYYLPLGRVEGRWGLTREPPAGWPWLWRGTKLKPEPEYNALNPRPWGIFNYEEESGNTQL